MENNINVSSAAGYYSLPKSGGNSSKENGRKTETFADAVKEKAAKITAETGIYDDTEKLSAEEYKLYIYYKISEMQRKSPQKLQRKNFVIVNISEEGFAAMQADPQYESWVL